MARATYLREMKCNRSFCLPVVPDQASEQELGLLRMTKQPSQGSLSATNRPLKKRYS